MLYSKHLKLGTKQCYLGHCLFLSQLRLRGRMERRECRGEAVFSPTGSLRLCLTQIVAEATFMPASAFLLLYDFFPDPLQVALLHIPCNRRWCLICLLPATLFWFPGLLPEVLLVESWKDSLSQSKSQWGCLIQGKPNQLCVMKGWKGSLLHCYHLSALLSSSNPVPAPGKK